MAGLVCPKCQGAMRSYERSGVTVDQCSECRGIFLDRGELERLIEAEGAYAPSSESGRPGDEHGSSQRDDERAPKRKKRSFLEGLFEGGD